MAKVTASKELSFEEALRKLEETVEKMESGDLPLDDIIKRYEEGMKLVGFCEKKLEAAAMKIEILTEGKTLEVSDLKSNNDESEEDDKGQVKLF